MLLLLFKLSRYVVVVVVDDDRMLLIIELVVDWMMMSIRKCRNIRWIVSFSFLFFLFFLSLFIDQFMMIFYVFRLTLVHQTKPKWFWFVDELCLNIFLKFNFLIIENQLCVCQFHSNSSKFWIPFLKNQRKSKTSIIR